MRGRARVRGMEKGSTKEKAAIEVRASFAA
jgi:hypothetical protein